MISDLQLSIADQIRDAYVEYRRRLFQHSYVPGRQHDDAWRKAAELCRTLRADPRVFIEAQFHVTIWGDGLCPQPNQLASKRVERGYEDYFEKRESFKPMAEEMLKQHFRYLSVFTLQNKMERDDALQQPESSNPFRFFFRLLVCSEEAFDSMMEKYGEQARAELRATSGLRELLLNDYEYRTQRILRTSVSGPDDGAYSPPPPASVPGRPREI